MKNYGKVPRKKSLTSAAALFLAVAMAFISMPAAANASDVESLSAAASSADVESLSAAAGATDVESLANQAEPQEPTDTSEAAEPAAAEPASAESEAAEPAAAESAAAEPTAVPSAEKNTVSPTIKGIVAIDPGHQGPSVDMSALEPDGPGSSNMKVKATSGTTGTFTGIGEYELNMDISLLLRAELEKRGYEVVLTREDNETAISNSERAILANESGADIYLRIHANGSTDAGVSGALAMSVGHDNPYASHLAAKSEELAYDILNCYCTETGMTNQGLIYTNTMTGLNWCEIPAMILEMGYMTNEWDDTHMANAEYRNQMVTGIANGVDLWYAVNPSPSAGQPRKMSGGKPVGTGSATTGTKDFPITPEMQELTDTINASYVQANESAGETWGVSVIDLTGRQMSSLNGDQPIKSASVLKLFIMAANYSQLYGEPDPSANTAAADASAPAGAGAVPAEAAEASSGQTSGTSADKEPVASDSAVSESVASSSAAEPTATETAATETTTASSAAETAASSSAPETASTDSSAASETAVAAAVTPAPDPALNDPELIAMFEAMITVSDNTAANNMVERLGNGDFEAGRAKLNAWCQSHGYTGTSMGRRFLASEFTEDNYTTANDCARLLASIYDRTCVNAEASEKMIGLLTRQTRLNKIPAGLTGYAVTTGNKTGELADQHLGFTENDAALVWGTQKDYALVVLTENLQSNQQTITQITEISKLVYEWIDLGNK